MEEKNKYEVEGCTEIVYKCNKCKKHYHKNSKEKRQ
jgi:hypothetical protein